MTTKVAMNNSATGNGGFIKFEESWFDIDQDDTPDGSSVEEETENLKA